MPISDPRSRRPPLNPVDALAVDPTGPPRKAPPLPPKPLRSARSYGKLDRDGFIHRSWIKGTGLPDDVFDGRPIIGICNTWSELVTCQVHLRDLAEYVKRGVWEAGGVPIEFPAMSLPETQMRPTAMLFRNLLAMEVEESIRANPIDGVVLMGGCDKTTPGLLMGAASVDLPAIVVSSGPMLNGKYRGPGHRLGHRRLALLRGGARRRDDPGRVHGRRGGHEPQQRRLQHHGHGLDHGQPGRGAGPLPAQQRRPAGGRFPPQGPGPPDRQPHRRDGAGGHQAVATS